MLTIKAQFSHQRKIFLDKLPVFPLSWHPVADDPRRQLEKTMTNTGAIVIIAIMALGLIAPFVGLLYVIRVER